MNIPNALTFLRIVLIPLFVFSLYFTQETYIAVFLLTIAVLSDWLDGYLARKLTQESEFGKWFDPIADRLLIVTVIVSIYFKFDFPDLLFLIILATREFMMFFGGVILNRYGHTIEVINLGKVATAVLFTSFIVILFNIKLGAPIFFLGLFLSIISGIIYIKRGFNLIMAGNGS